MSFKEWLIISIVLGFSGMGWVAAEKNQPVQLTITPQKQIYEAREGLTVNFEFKAKQALNLCLEKNPLTQFQLTVSRGGKGTLPLAPIVQKDTREYNLEPMKVVHLNPGQLYIYRANLKQLQFLDGETWEPGDYHLIARFGLCAQDVDNPQNSTGKEIPIEATYPGRFMISN